MLTTPHALVGLVIIQKIPHPIGLLVSLISHFLIDFFIPHWNPHLYTEFKKTGGISSSSIKIILVDGFLAVALTLFFMFKNLPAGRQGLLNLSQAFLYGLSSFMAVLPDAIEIPYYFLNWKSKCMKKYVYFTHKYQADAGIFWGMLTQILVVIASLKVLLSS